MYFEIYDDWVWILLGFFKRLARVYYMGYHIASEWVNIVTFVVSGPLPLQFFVYLAF